MYSIEFTKTAKDFLHKLPKKDTEIIIKKVFELKDNPIKFLKRLQGHKLYRLRVLKYRVIIDVIVSGNKIIVVQIGLRKNVYDNLNDPVSREWSKKEDNTWKDL